MNNTAPVQGTEVQTEHGYGIVVWTDSLGKGANEEIFVGVHLESGIERVYFPYEIEVIVDVRIS
jgi:hypothetical protein